MRLSLYSIGQYTCSKKYYIMRLSEVSDYGSVVHRVIVDQIETKKDASLILKRANEIGLKPYRDTFLDLLRYQDELVQTKTKPLTPFFTNLSGVSK